MRLLALTGCAALAFATLIGPPPFLSSAIAATTPAVLGTADPAAYVRGLYARSAGDVRPAEFKGYSHDPIFSPRLRAMFADDEAYAKGELGRLEFSPFTGTQDDDIKGVTVTTSPVDGAPGRRIVTARFRNMNQPATMIFYFTRIGTRWYIDDIASPGMPGGTPWTLSLILLYGN